MMNAERVEIFNQGARVSRQVNTIAWTTEDLHKHGYDHFMLKEIHEQPRVIRDTISEYSANRGSGGRMRDRYSIKITTTC